MTEPTEAMKAMARRICARVIEGSTVGKIARREIWQHVGGEA